MLLSITTYVNNNETSHNLETSATSQDHDQLQHKQYMHTMFRLHVHPRLREDANVYRVRTQRSGSNKSYGASGTWEHRERGSTPIVEAVVARKHRRRPAAAARPAPAAAARAAPARDVDDRIWWGWGLHSKPLLAHSATRFGPGVAPRTGEIVMFLTC